MQLVTTKLNPKLLILLISVKKHIQKAYREKTDGIGKRNNDNNASLLHVQRLRVLRLFILRSGCSHFELFKNY